MVWSGANQECKQFFNRNECDAVQNMEQSVTVYRNNLKARFTTEPNGAGDHYAIKADHYYAHTRLPDGDVDQTLLVWTLRPNFARLLVACHGKHTAHGQCILGGYSSGHDTSVEKLEKACTENMVKLPTDTVCDNHNAMYYRELLNRHGITKDDSHAKALSYMRGVKAKPALAPNAVLGAVSVSSEQQDIARELCDEVFETALIPIKSGRGVCADTVHMKRTGNPATEVLFGDLMTPRGEKGYVLRTGNVETIQGGTQLEFKIYRGGDNKIHKDALGSFDDGAVKVVIKVGCGRYSMNLSETLGNPQKQEIQENDKIAYIEASHEGVVTFAIGGVGMIDDKGPVAHGAEKCNGKDKAVSLLFSMMPTMGEAGEQRALGNPFEESKAQTEIVVRVINSLLSQKFLNPVESFAALQSWDNFEPGDQYEHTLPRPVPLASITNTETKALVVWHPDTQTYDTCVREKEAVLELNARATGAAATPLRVFNTEDKNEQNMLNCIVLAGCDVSFPLATTAQLAALTDGQKAELLGALVAGRPKPKKPSRGPFKLVWKPTRDALNTLIEKAARDAHQHMVRGEPALVAVDPCDAFAPHPDVDTDEWTRVPSAAAETSPVAWRDVFTGAGLDWDDSAVMGKFNQYGQTFVGNFMEARGSLCHGVQADLLSLFTGRGSRNGHVMQQWPNARVTRSVGIPDDPSGARPQAKFDVRCVDGRDGLFSRRAEDGHVDFIWKPGAVSSTGFPSTMIMLQQSPTGYTTRPLNPKKPSGLPCAPVHFIALMQTLVPPKVEKGESTHRILRQAWTGFDVAIEEPTVETAPAYVWDWETERLTRIPTFSFKATCSAVPTTELYTYMVAAATVQSRNMRIQSQEQWTTIPQVLSEGWVNFEDHRTVVRVSEKKGVGNDAFILARNALNMDTSGASKKAEANLGLAALLDYFGPDKGLTLGDRKRLVHLFQNHFCHKFFRYFDTHDELGN